MRMPTLVIALHLALAASAYAKGPADYFHGAARLYVEGRQQEALVEVEEGLRRFPDDPTLKTFASHLGRLKDQKRQDQGAQGSQGGEQGKDEKDKQQGDQGAGQGGNEPQEPGKPEGEQEGEKPEDKGAGQGEAGKEEEGADTAGRAQAPVKPGEMSKEEAERLLNSIQDDEKKEHRQQQKRWRKRPEVEQDW